METAKLNELKEIVAQTLEAKRVLGKVKVSIGYTPGLARSVIDINSSSPAL